jgi:hypothetical protein
LHVATDIHGIPVTLETLAGFASLQVKQGNLEHAFVFVLMILYHSTGYKKPKTAPSLCGPTWESN